MLCEVLYRKFKLIGIRLPLLRAARLARPRPASDYRDNLPLEALVAKGEAQSEAQLDWTKTMATTDWPLYRGIKKDAPLHFTLDSVASDRENASSDGLLHARTGGAVETDANGVQFVKAPDVVLERSADDAPWYVLTDGGTSMHDVPGWFGFNDWSYFYVPKGTQYCAESLFIKPDKRSKWNKSKTVKGRHYTIRPKTRMRRDTYFGALDNLARAAIVRSVELGRSIRISSADEAEAHAALGYDTETDPS